MSAASRGDQARPGWFGPVQPTDDRADGSDQYDEMADDGRALIEVVFLAVLMLIPVVYILSSLLRIQAATFAVTQAARDAGRAVDGATTIAEAVDRARDIAVIDLADQNVPADRITLRFVTAGSPCGDNDVITPSLEPGAVYDICVTAVIKLPGVPTVLTGSDNTITGVYTVHIGELREG